MEFFSQCGQDKFLETYVFKGFKNGTYMDIGAHDGLMINNSWFFEKTHGWKGILVEPLPEVYKRLVVNRPNNILLDCAVCDKEGSAEFISNIGGPEMLSGLKSEYDPRHAQRHTMETQANGGQLISIEAQARRVESICDEHAINHIHYMSIDVEGAEFAVIKSINFDKVFIDVIDFENNFVDTSAQIIDYLETKNYIVIYRRDDIIMIHQQSKFYRA